MEIDNEKKFRQGKFKFSPPQKYVQPRDIM
jgi:hypothetical protein